MLDTVNANFHSCSMTPGKRLAYRLALVGFAFSVILFAYLEMTDYRPFGPALIAASFVLCPASVLSAGFLDVEPHSPLAILAWLLIALLNGGLYGLIGYAVGKYVLKTA